MTPSNDQSITISEVRTNSIAINEEPTDTVIEINDESIEKAPEAKRSIEDFMLEKMALILIQLEPTYHKVHDFINHVRKMEHQPEDYMVGINLYGDEAGTKDEKVEALKPFLRDYIKGHVPKGKSFVVGWIIKIALSELLLEHIGMDFIPATVAGISVGSVLALRFYPIFNNQTLSNAPVPQVIAPQENASNKWSSYLGSFFSFCKKTPVDVEVAQEAEQTRTPLGPTTAVK